jgi:hypothetical protein
MDRREDRGAVDPVHGGEQLVAPGVEEGEARARGLAGVGHGLQGAHRDQPRPQGEGQPLGGHYPGPDPGEGARADAHRDGGDLFGADLDLPEQPVHLAEQPLGVIEGPLVATEVYVAQRRARIFYPGDGHVAAPGGCIHAKQPAHRPTPYHAASAPAL